MKLKRGMRVRNQGYRGTIVEIGVIPHCVKSCVCNPSAALDVKGALVYWDHMVNTVGCEIYPDSLNRGQSHDANDGRADSFQWIGLKQIESYMKVQKG